MPRIHVICTHTVWVQLQLNGYLFPQKKTATQEDIWIQQNQGHSGLHPASWVLSPHFVLRQRTHPIDPLKSDTLRYGWWIINQSCWWPASPIKKSLFWNTEKPIMRKVEKIPTIMRIYHQPSTIPLLWTYLLLRQPWWVNTPSASLTDCCCWLRLRASLHGKIIAAYESLKIKGSSSPWLSKQYHLRGRGWRSIQMFHGFPHGFPKMFRQILSQCWENHGQCQTIHGTYGGNIQNYRPKYVSSKIFPRFFATHPNCAPSSILEPLALKRVRMINPSKNSSQWQPCN